MEAAGGGVASWLGFGGGGRGLVIGVCRFGVTVSGSACVDVLTCLVVLT